MAVLQYTKTKRRRNIASIAYVLKKQKTNEASTIYEIYYTVTEIDAIWYSRFSLYQKLVPDGTRGFSYNKSKPVTNASRGL